MSVSSHAGSSAYMDAVEAQDRAEARAERLQHRLDEEHALVAALRKQLREQSTSSHQVAAQLRQVQGAPGAPDAPGGSLASMQRTVAALRDRIEVEKKAANTAQAESARLQKQLSTAAKERQTLLASQQELRSELQRRCAELDRANAVLRDSGSAHDEAIGQVSSLTFSRDRERQAYEKEIAALRQSLEVERKRSANRASRAAAAEAARRRARDPNGSGSVGSEGSTASGSITSASCSGGGGSSIGGGSAELSELSEVGTELGDLHVADGMGFGRPMDFDVPTGGMAAVCRGGRS
jgi:chromosome segregation ATPase